VWISQRLQSVNVTEFHVITGFYSNNIGGVDISTSAERSCNRYWQNKIMTDEAKSFCRRQQMLGLLIRPAAGEQTIYLSRAEGDERIIKSMTGLETYIYDKTLTIFFIFMCSLPS
jgi:hypothetical protein